ncbi:ClpXP protease specificity-enhancing factor SspB [Magnetovibrio sp. PR-2]|uniref:SspB family protein n=1 Tax=Magnetovibrio sp. PR-2 TaxID=3120356 RepID=UPI002FCDF7AC
MTDDTLRYDIWVEEALRSVIKKTLSHVAEHGLPGDHHFYISFQTQAEGVEIPARLRAQHPNDMTIVLQYQFEDLQATEDTLSVTLSFGGQKENLLIPYESVISFADPSVNFALQLKMLPLDEDDELEDVEFDGLALDDDDYDARHLEYFEESRRRTGQDELGGAGDEGEQKTGEVIALDAFRKK